MKKYQIVVALIAIVFLGCQVNPVTGKKEIVLMSEEQEIQMGKEAYPEIIAQYGLYDNPALQDYINKNKYICKLSKFSAFYIYKISNI